ncbi:MAG: GMC family oxidoreductase [Gemmatimonadetes bacterium]|nr:GMC family oxidoreductase [Gemmatimonadota bacterium]
MTQSRTAQFKPSDTVDFVIVGSGAAGGVMAKQLATRGHTVVVMEQGPRADPTEWHHDEIRGQAGITYTNNATLQPQTFRRTEADVARVGGGRLSYHRLVGGGSVMFTANYWRFHEIDFIEKSKLGAIPGSSLEDWPITYADLEPYYTQAEWELGVSGEPGPFDPPRSRPYPLPPMPVKSSGVLFSRGATAMGWHPQPTPMAILSRPYNGRPACQHCGFCFGNLCEYQAKSGTLYTVIPIAEATGKCEIRPNSYVRKVEHNAKGRVTGVTYFDEKKVEQFQKAKAVVLCCNGAETPRLLLMSKSNLFPNGLANSSDKVGRYLMFNGGGGANAIFEEPLNEYKSIVDTRMIHDFYDSDPRRGFYGGGGLDSRGPYSPISFANGGLPPDSPRWGSAYKKMIGELFVRTMSASGHTTTLPLETNRVDLDPELKDDWGLPCIRQTYKNHPDDLKTFEFFGDRAKELLEAAGAKRVWDRNGPARDQSGGVHLLGTCRMGNDPKTSVVDKFHRAHDVRNLFICDGSSLVTGGRGQPTATIQALAYRAGEVIAAFAKKGDI